MPAGLAGRLLAVTVTCAALVCGWAGPAGAQVSGDAEAAFLARMTAARQAAGRAPLPIDTDLVGVARAHSQEMATVNRLFHNSALGQQVQQWILVAENVGVGSTVDQIHQTLMGSPTHRSDILDPRYTGVGIGVVQSGGTLWVTQVFRQRDGAAPPPPPPAPAPAPAPSPPPAPAPAPAPPTTVAVAKAAPPRPAPTTTTTTVATTTVPPTLPPVTVPPAVETPPVTLATAAAPAVELEPVEVASSQPVPARQRLLASALVAVAFLWAVGVALVRAVILDRRLAYAHRRS